MFGRFFSWIGRTIKWGFENTWTYFKEYFGGLWALLLLIGVFLTKAIDYPIRMMNWVIARIDALHIPDYDFTLPLQLSSVMSVANTWFPLDEFVRYLASYIILLLGLAAVRLIMRFIGKIFGFGLGG